VTQLINIDFSGTLTTDFNKGSGTYAAYSAGRLSFSGEGLILAKQSCGTGNKWMRFRLVTLTPDDVSIGVAIGDASGNGVILLLFNNSSASPPALAIHDASAYTTYTTWANADQALDNTFDDWAAGNAIGMTFEPSTNIVRIWPFVTAAAPTAINSWDGAAAPAFETLSFDFGATHAYLGFGSWSSAPAAHTIDDFTAGDFSAGGGTTPVTRSRRSDSGGMGPEMNGGISARSSRIHVPRRSIFLPSLKPHVHAGAMMR
jgi:hypothetical protein